MAPLWKMVFENEIAQADAPLQAVQIYDAAERFTRQHVRYGRGLFGAR